MIGKTLGHYEILEPLGKGGMGEVYRAHSFRYFRCAASLLAILLASGCTDLDRGPVPLTAEVPLHLEDHLDVATVVGSEVPEDIPEPVEWRFDEPQPDWKPWVPPNPTRQPVKVTRRDDALRVTLTEGTRWPDGGLRGGLYIELPDWQREDWAYVLVRARTSEEIRSFGIEFNLREGPLRLSPSPAAPFRFRGEYVNVIHDGSVQTYLLRVDWYWAGGRWEGPWQQLGLWFNAGAPASVDLLSVRLVPKAANYAAASAGVRTAVRNRAYRRTLYTHAPGRLEYRVRVPTAGRLDVGLGVLRDDAPVIFRITARLADGQTQSLLEETYGDKEHWAQHSVDLSSLAGQTVTLALEVESEREGTVALWGAPTLTGAGTPRMPNVIFYVIDGGGADYMSVYGYNRRTTPNLQRLATERAIFEHAYSNSSWTKPSTASFMTSLQHSVLGGYKNWNDPVPI